MTRCPQPPTGEPFEWPTVFVFVERLDGTTPEFFSRNWYVHASHTDGVEAENDDARAQRAERERTPGNYYMQHRILEPIAATPWVAHGYTKLAMPAFIPAEELRTRRPLSSAATQVKNPSTAGRPASCRAAPTRFREEHDGQGHLDVGTSAW